jgi:hypothetical protein
MDSNSSIGGESGGFHAEREAEISYAEAGRGVSEV